MKAFCGISRGYGKESRNHYGNHRFPVESDEDELAPDTTSVGRLRKHHRMGRLTVSRLHALGVGIDWSLKRA